MNCYSRGCTLWIFVPLMNFFIWFHIGSYIGQKNKQNAKISENNYNLYSTSRNSSCPYLDVPHEVYERPCPKPPNLRVKLKVPSLNPNDSFNNNNNNNINNNNSNDLPTIDVVDPFEFGKFKAPYLVELNYYAYTLLLNFNKGTPCHSYVNPTANR